mmetsp:Transcript_692/g.2690  ORF Transcript_692/g.2690 Transcript_692/m.2690 type:complete len:117 (-) Transcript_692:1597-1947(-)
MSHAASIVQTRVRVGAHIAKPVAHRRVASAASRSPPRARRVVARIGSAGILASSPVLAATPELVELARSDAWFGWYFAPGGFILGPALLLTIFLVGGAVFEKVTGKAVSSKPMKKK